MAHRAVLAGQRPVKRCATNAVTGCNGLGRFVIVDQLPGMGYLLRRQFPLTPELHTAGFCGLNARPRSLADKAALQFRRYANHLPHRAACWRVSVDSVRKGAKLDAALLEVVQHGYQITHATTEAIEFPHDQGIAWL